MRERLDDHSLFLEEQLAGLEALVKEKGEVDVVVPAIEQDDHMRPIRSTLPTVHAPPTTIKSSPPTAGTTAKAVLPSSVLPPLTAGTTAKAVLPSSVLPPLTTGTTAKAVLPSSVPPPAVPPRPPTVVSTLTAKTAAAVSVPSKPAQIAVSMPDPIAPVAIPQALQQPAKPIAPSVQPS